MNTTRQRRNKNRHRRRMYHIDSLEVKTNMDHLGKVESKIPKAPAATGRQRPLKQYGSYNVPEGFYLGEDEPGQMRKEAIKKVLKEMKGGKI